MVLILLYPPAMFNISHYSLWFFSGFGGFFFFFFCTSQSQTCSFLWFQGPKFSTEIDLKIWCICRCKSKPRHMKVFLFVNPGEWTTSSKSTHLFYHPLTYATVTTFRFKYCDLHFPLHKLHCILFNNLNPLNKPAPSSVVLPVCEYVCFSQYSSSLWIYKLMVLFQTYHAGIE